MHDKIDISSNDNALFVTGRCNNRCLMCCQPPVKRNDISFFYEKNIRILDSAPKDLDSLGITGGEPTLLGEKLIELVAYAREKLPSTQLHILTNGRAFRKGEYAEKLCAAGGEFLSFGIPIHSDSPIIHDEVSGASGAYYDTLLGLYNLAACDANIELRVVINNINFRRLPAMARFFIKNLIFVRSVSLMAMEDTGYTIKNRNRIWIEPKDYMTQLEEATLRLAEFDIDVNLFNLPLCLLPESLRPFARKSISDWKNKFVSECEMCSVKNDCCGFFSTSKSLFQGICAL